MYVLSWEVKCQRQIRAARCNALYISAAEVISGVHAVVLTSVMNMKWGVDRQNQGDGPTNSVPTISRDDYLHEWKTIMLLIRRVYFRSQTSRLGRMQKYK